MNTDLKNIDLTGYIALVTGGSSGIGFEMSKALLSKGATVIIASRKSEKLENAAKALSAFGDVHAVPMDVRDELSVAAAKKWFEEHFDHLDMLVNDAGIGDNAPGMNTLKRGHSFLDVPVSAVKTIIETNLIGFFTVSSAFTPLLIKNGGGRLLYVSTSDATMTRKGQIPYGPSKAGAEAMAAVMAEDLSGTGVTVNIICPGGFTDTPMAGPGSKEFFLENNMPILSPDVLNDTIVFLASPLSDGINREKIVGKEFAAWLEKCVNA